MFVNRIKICPDLHKLQLWFSRLRQCLFLKLLRGAPELGSGRVVPAGTLIFARSGSGRNWLKKHGRNRNSVIFRELEYRIYLLNKIDQTDWKV